MAVCYLPFLFFPPLPSLSSSLPSLSSSLPSLLSSAPSSPLLPSLQLWLVTRMWWAGVQRLLRFVRWRMDNWTVCSCTRGHSDSASSVREMTRYWPLCSGCPCTVQYRDDRPAVVAVCFGHFVLTLCTVLCCKLKCATEDGRWQACSGRCCTALFWPLSQLYCCAVNWRGCSRSSNSPSATLSSLPLPSCPYLSPPPPPPSLSLSQVFFASIRSTSSSQVYFMALNRRLVPQ